MSNKYAKHFVCFFLALLGMTQSAVAADFKDFSAIVNNQTGTLLTADEQVQGTAVEFGIAVAADGTVSRVAAGDASSVATISGKYHSDHGCTGLKVVVPVPGNVTILVGQCTYSKKDIVVKNSAGETVVTKTPATACWKNDRSNVTELIYKGEATTLTISGMDYCPFVAVKKYVAPAAFRNVYVDLTGSLVQSSEKTEGVNLNFGVAIDENGNQTRVAADDPSAVVVLSGIWHDGQHGWTKAKAVANIEGPVKIGVGNCTYGGHDASYTDPAGNTVTFTTTTECWSNGTPTEKVTYIDYKGEAGKLSVSGAGYTPYFSIETLEVKPNKLEDAAVKATFPFALGTEKQIASFDNEMDFYFLSSKVTHGSNLNIVGTKAHAGMAQTAFQPIVQDNKAGKAENDIKFLIRPYPGLKFKPTKVSLNATRYGTDGGSLNFAWQNPDGTTVVIDDSGQKANRNNTEAPSAFSFDVTGATPAEGECGLVINLYSLGNNKQLGIANVIIEGTLTGEKQEIPILASFKANGEEVIVEDVFAIDGEDYVANFELSKKITMIGQSNPITDVTVAVGTLGTITYEGDATKSKVTIPVTHNGITLKWVANYAQKPDFTLTYYEADGTTVIGTQSVEKDAKIEAFAFAAPKAPIADGYRYRGWAQKLSGSGNRKFTVDDVITGNTNLYALVTPIDVATASARFDFNLGDEFFYMEDHEVIASEGKGYWHDGQHGWAFQNGDKLKIQMGGKGYIKMSLCQYSGNGTIKLLGTDGEEVASIAAKVSSDGAAGTIMYDGAAGEVTLAFDGVTYVHNISIVNMAENPYTQNGDWYMVKPGDASSLITTLEIVNGSASADKRTYIYIPNGTYDLGEKCLTQVSGQNISLIGESMDGVIIQNHPTAEGIGITATILNTSSNLYMQDLTLKNALNYFDSKEAGRAVAFQDKGKQTICKNVKLLSYQDTYWSNGSGQFYWETSEIHGVVDYMCGGGDVYYNKCLLVNESRAVTPKSGSVTMTAPYANSSDKFGYLFESCTIENLAKNFNFGRSWGGNSMLNFLNTTINQPDELAATRFTTSGMNTLAYAFYEYNSMDKNGNVVSPASNVLTFTHSKDSKTYETILTKEQADAFAYEKLFTTWDPRSLAAQAPMPNFVKLEGTTLTWSENNADKMWAVLKNGNVVAFTTTASYTIDDADAQYAVRAANKMGGLSEAVAVDAYATVTLAETGYATFYDSENSYKIPAELKANVVTAATTSALTYAELTDIIPAGTAVMLESADKTGGEYCLPITSSKAIYTGANLLKGSDVATTTTADVKSLFYKLAYGSSKGSLAASFGWFWGAADGGAFQIEGHRAWLAIPEQQAAAVRAYLIGGSIEGTTAIRNIETNDTTNDEYYNLQGQRIYAPGKGLYIHNNKKVIIK